MCWYYRTAHGHVYILIHIYTYYVHAWHAYVHCPRVGEHFTTGGRHFCNYSAKLI